MIEPFTFVAPTASADGYGYSAEALTLAAVREHGADIAFIGYDWADERYTDPELLEIKARTHVAEIHDRDTAVIYFLPFALGSFQGRRTTINMTMWETDRMPDVWATLAERHCSGMLVPSEHCRSVFSQRVSHPIEVVPFGTDTGLFAEYRRNPDRPEPFRFLMTGMLHYRKGVDFALRAFREEFAANEPVELWLKTRLTFLDPGDERGMLMDPRVKIIADDYAREAMCELYWQADCLLAPSRGEGSGLTPRDAMATGLPVILTDWGGLAEIADERYNWPIPVEALEPAPYENSSYGPGVTGPGELGNFARPSVQYLRAHMREVYEDRAGAYERGRAAADWMRRQWTWEHSAFHWLKAIERLGAEVAA